MADTRIFRNLIPVTGGVMGEQSPNVAHRRKAKLDRKLEEEKIETMAVDALVDNLVVAGSFQHAGDTLAFFAGSAVTQRPAFTQTYSTADRTIAAPTATTLTHGVGTADGTVDDVGAAFNQTTLNNNTRELTDQIANIVADILDLKQAVNALVDTFQAYTLVAS